MEQIKYSFDNFPAVWQRVTARGAAEPAPDIACPEEAGRQLLPAAGGLGQSRARRFIPRPCSNLTKRQQSIVYANVNSAE
jgi:hypothetical protein